MGLFNKRIGPVLNSLGYQLSSTEENLDASNPPQCGSGVDKDPPHAHTNMTDEEVEKLRQECRDYFDKARLITWLNRERRKAVIELYKNDIIDVDEARLMLGLKRREEGEA